MNNDWKSKISEEFLFGFFAPILVILVDWLTHLFDFLYYFFPVVLVLGAIVCLITKRWRAALGIVAFVVFAFVVRGFFPELWTWVASDKKLFIEITKNYV